MRLALDDSSNLPAIVRAAKTTNADDWCGYAAGTLRVENCQWIRDDDLHVRGYCDLSIHPNGDAGTYTVVSGAGATQTIPVYGTSVFADVFGANPRLIPTTD